ncbi:MAG: hypothetical protein GXO48_08840, partial [Chlorobi bacterium]|nr:hypothetical protein [Chlorobiota bacterium]
MIDIELDIKNFLAIKQAKIKTVNNITVIIAPNRAGKTQLMLLIYSILWSWWKVSKDNHFLDLYEGTIMRDIYPEFKKTRDLENELKKKIKNVLLVKKTEDILMWGKKEYNVSLKS